MLTPILGDHSESHKKSGDEAPLPFGFPPLLAANAAERNFGHVIHFCVADVATGVGDRHVFEPIQVVAWGSTAFDFCPRWERFAWASHEHDLWEAEDAPVVLVVAGASDVEGCITESTSRQDPVALERDCVVSESVQIFGAV